MRKDKDIAWIIHGRSIPEVQLHLLMDLRDELQRLNALLHCSNFTAIPHILREISANTKKRKRRKKK